MAQTDDAAPAGADRFPRVPAHAWSWLQRSRPVVAEASRRLTGGPPPQGFVDTLRQRFADDPFTRDVLVDVIAEVAFNGRIPRRRPPGVSWDRGLTWWAAAIAGTSLAAFEAAGEPVVQSRLFGDDPAPPAQEPPAAAGALRGGAQRGVPRRGAAAMGGSAERRMVVAMLRDLLRNAEDGCVPAAAVEQLLGQLESAHWPEGPARQ